MTEFETMILCRLDDIANQREQENALLASIAESLRMICDAVERATGNDEEM